MPQNRAFTQSEWQTLIKCAKDLFKQTKILAGPEGTGKPIIDNDEISFNGKGDDSYESFGITKELNSQFNFCKTARKSYDDYVIAVLCLAHSIAPDALDISSDGEYEEWDVGFELAKKIYSDSSRPPLEEDGIDPEHGY